jgi:phosphoglycolate phosphatase-like HAD superfamily hydrolase
MDKRVFAFDFDGTLCDGLHECVLVTWNGHHDLGIEAFGDTGLQEIPAAFIARFQQLRNYAKHLGHFAVPLLSDAIISSQEEFDRAYEALGEDVVYDFVLKVTRYRHAARRSCPDRWLGYHAFYPGVEHLLKSRTDPLYVVTAKDAESVQSIFAANQLSFPPHHVFGEQRSKLEALKAIAAKEGIERDQLYFFDDNVFNAIDAKRAGFSAFWAGWGYSVPSHFDLAARAGMSPLQLEDFVRGGYDHVDAVRALHDSCV